MTGETKPCTSMGEMSNQAEGTADAKELRHRVLSVCEEQQRDQCDRSSVSEGKRLDHTVVLEKILESPLDSKEIQPVNLKGNQS